MKALANLAAFLAAFLLFSTLTSCAAYQEQLQQVEGGLRLGNDLALIAERCTKDSLERAIAHCQTLPQPGESECLKMVEDTAEATLKVLEEWRRFRCDVLGGLGSECEEPKPEPEHPPTTEPPPAAPRSPPAPAGEGGSGSA